MKVPTLSSEGRVAQGESSCILFWPRGGSLLWGHGHVVKAPCLSADLNERENVWTWANHFVGMYRLQHQLSMVKMSWGRSASFLTILKG